MRQIGRQNAPQPYDVYLKAEDDALNSAQDALNSASLDRRITTDDTYIVSGLVNRDEVDLATQYTFQETTANSMISNAAKWYFKSLDKIVSTVQKTVKWPEAPIGNDLVTNGRFDTDISGWTDASTGTGSFIWDAGTASGKLTRVDGNNNGIMRTLTSSDSGEFVLEFKVLSTSTLSTLQIREWRSSDNDISPVISASLSVTANSYYKVKYNRTNGYDGFEFRIAGGDGTFALIDNVAVFKATDLMRYDNLMLRDDGTQYITQTEKNIFDTQDTVLNFTSNLYSIVDGSDTATSVTFTYDVTTEEYTGSDGYKYITIGSTARFNQGGYHPVYNKYGTARFRSTLAGVGTSTSQDYWYNLAEPANPPLSIYDCHNELSLDEAGVGYHAFSGAYGQNSGRPDGKYYDVIYNETFIDQRFGAKAQEAGKELTTVERDKDISATQRADFVGSATWETVENVSATPAVKGYNSTIGHTYVDFGVITTNYSEDTLDAATFNSSERTEYSGFIKDASSNFYAVKLQLKHSGDNRFYTYLANHYGDITATLNIVGTCKVYVQRKSNFRYGSTTYLHTDIIGNPANYPVDWLSSLAGGGSIEGVPLLVGEKGEDYIPDGTSTAYKMSKKSVSDLTSVQYTADAGTSWTEWTSVANVSFNQTTNALSMTVGALFVSLNAYKAYNNNLAPIVNLPVEKGSAGISDIFATQHSLATVGNKLLPSLLGKIGVSNTVPSRIEGISIDRYGAFYGDTKFYIDAISIPFHKESILLGNLDSPATKLFSYLNQGTRAKQVYVFKEMYFDNTQDIVQYIDAGVAFSAVVGETFILRGFTNSGINGVTVEFKLDFATTWATTIFDGYYVFGTDILNTVGEVWSVAKLWDGNGFGDNNKFNIVDNVSTTTDDNGNVILIGQKSRLYHSRIK